MARGVNVPVNIGPARPVGFVYLGAWQRVGGEELAGQAHGHLQGVGPVIVVGTYELSPDGRQVICSRPATSPWRELGEVA